MTISRPDGIAWKASWANEAARGHLWRRLRSSIWTGQRGRAGRIGQFVWEVFPDGAVTVCFRRRGRIVGFALYRQPRLAWVVVTPKRIIRGGGPSPYSALNPRIEAALMIQRP